MACHIYLQVSIFNHPLMDTLIAFMAIQLFQNYLEISANKIPQFGIVQFKITDIFSLQYIRLHEL